MREAHNLVDLALERLLTIRWEEADYDRSWSYAALLMEHFRRVSLWHEVLSPTEPLYLETYDVAGAVAPMPEVVRRTVDTVWLPHIERLDLTRQTIRDTVGYLHWSGVLDSSWVKGVGLPCPYEPVIRLYERGGCYSAHHGDWEVMGVMFCRSRGEQYRDRPPLMALDDASLNEIDAE